jgi:hypothetical protein
MEFDITSMDDALAALDQIGDALIKTAKVTDASSCGLDDRCGTLYIGDDFIASRNSSRLDYYGGFEYIEKEYKQTIGDYTFYAIDHDRVRDAIEAYEERAVAN